VKRHALDVDTWASWAAWSAAALGVTAIASWMLVALAHIDDGYHVDHVAGAWMGLTQAADDGTLYPPLYEDGRFGGTRYMPLPIALNTAAAKVTGEYLVSGKLVGGLVVAVLLTLVAYTARRLGADWRISMACVGAVIATFTAFFAGTTMYGDALPVLLQLSAIGVVLQTTTKRAVSIAAVLAALAVAAKLSAFWGGAAVVAWLVLRDRGRLPAFVLAALGTGFAVLGVAEVVSEGRFGDNLGALAFSGFTGTHALLIETPQKLIELLGARSDATLVLLPVAIAVLVAGATRRRFDPVGLALIPAAVVTMVVLTDEGTDFNHLLDLAVLTPIVIAGAYGRASSGVLRLGFAAVLSLAIVTSLFELRQDVREAGSAIVRHQTPLRFRTPPGPAGLVKPYFTEDPSVAVERGAQPVALDSFTLLRLLGQHPEWRRDLIARFDRREFTTVLLIHDLDLSDPWWSESHLGLEVATAIERSYRFARSLPGPVFRYRVYVPRTGQTRTASATSNTKSRATTSQDGKTDNSLSS
jgi:hypothetical protein